MTATLQHDELAELLGRYRAELAGFCRRRLGPAGEPDDAVQDTMLRAWRGLGGYDGRASVRTWLYRIATNVCADALRRRGRGAVPVDLDDLPDACLPAGADPAELALTRESVRLALVVAVTRLPQRQRAVLILRDVLGWPARDVADLLGTTAASVNSALQRARGTLADRAQAGPAAAGGDPELLRRYVSAFERHDVAGLVALLRAGHPRAPDRPGTGARGA